MLFLSSSVIRGHHIYKTVWSPSTGEILEAAREPNNSHDHHAVCLRKAEVIVGHVPRHFGRVFFFFPKSWWENYVRGDRKTKVW